MHTLDCGTLAIRLGNPGYAFSDGQKIADQLSIAAPYHLTLHGWDSPKDIVAATPVEPTALTVSFK